MYTTNDDTICAPATVPGTGAISIIRVSGPKAIGIAAKVVSCKDLEDAPGYTVRFGTVFQPNGKPLDDVLVSVFRAPHSYTGEDSVEISCHASKFIAEGIMQLLIGAGARTAEPGEFTQRAFINGKMDLAQAEAVADLIASQNAAAHRVAINQLKGGFSKELKKMREQMLHIVSLMELELDFSDEEVQFADRGELDDLLKATIRHISTLMESFRLGNVIKNGVPVAIVGATNTGKSTLLNALLGEERAIVSDVHGTTRDTVEETMNINGILFRFIDTAGIRQTDETVEKIGIERTYRKLHEAAIVLAMLDITRSKEELAGSIKEILDKVDLKQQKLIFLLNKCDLSEEENEGNEGDLACNNFVNIKNFIVSLIEEHSIKIFDRFKWYEANAKGDHDGAIGIMPISAKTGNGLDSLRATLSDTQKDLLADSDTTLITNARHYEALSNARDALVRVRAGLSDALPTDLLTQDIREALYHIGSIVGEISTDEVLGNIFRNFCIGK